MNARWVFLLAFALVFYGNGALTRGLTWHAADGADQEGAAAHSQR